MHPDFKVYRWQLGNITYLQVNDNAGRAIAAHSINPDEGSRDISNWVRSSNTQAGTLSEDDGDGQCPCEAQEIASGDGWVLFAIVDSNGNFIETVLVEYEPE